MPRKYTDEDRRKIVDYYVAGHSLREVVERFTPTNYTTVFECVKAAGALRSNEIDKDRREKLIELYQSGTPLRRAAKAANISEGAANRILKLAGIDIRSKKGAINECKQDVVSLYSQGFTLEEVGNKLGFSVNAVYQLLKREGIQVRNLKQSQVLNWLRPEYRTKLLIKFGSFDGNSPSWKGGMETPTRQIRGSKTYSDWRRGVLVRDRFTCQECGTKKNVKGNPLHVDHIYPFRKLLADHNIFTVEQAEECPELWNLDNGRTLCKKCHLSTETWGGRAGKRR
ncbi:HNH endonuclease [Spirosoma oryzicola]|uniref:HNH endonuclease n=1 Tax=Spirosoma oryzicola TaxID=2898794 RepID=UPI001E38E7FC|nr:HNH endonuclease signature motif containing protein [Spirosoma oryzicola]UHG93246.1 HNH endonuclease [Spirosoma oryzicola]